MLSEVVSTLEELQRLHRLNLELLEQLDVTCTWLFDNHVKMPNESAFYSLLSKTKAILVEIQADELKTLMYNISRRKVTTFDEKEETDGDVTEPYFRFCKVLEA